MIFHVVDRVFFKRNMPEDLPLEICFHRIVTLQGPSCDREFYIDSRVTTIFPNWPLFSR